VTLPGAGGRRSTRMSAVKLRLPPALERQLPASGPRRWAVLAMLAAGGIVALLVPVFFAVVLASMLRGG
jgi:hypothetical protein